MKVPEDASGAGHVPVVDADGYELVDDGDDAEDGYYATSRAHEAEHHCRDEGCYAEGWLDGRRWQAARPEPAPPAREVTLPPPHRLVYHDGVNWHAVDGAPPVTDAERAALDRLEESMGAYEPDGDDRPNDLFASDIKTLLALARRAVGEG